MELTSLYRCVAALDVHQSKLTVCVIAEDERGAVEVFLREFGGFKRDRKAMAQWVAGYDPQVVVMESTGIYWKSPYAALEQAGLQPWVVNARHVKKVPGRKTDLSDAQWLATLARSGLLQGSFVPPAQFRELRVISRQAQKLTGTLSAEKNRLHKVLTDAGIRLGVVVSDVHGKSARSMVKGLIRGERPEQVLRYADKRLKATEAELLEALDGELTDSHRFVLSKLMEHIEYLEQQILDYRQQLMAGLQPQKPILQALQTLPGMDEAGAATLLVEITDDMSAFGSPDRLASWAGICPANNESAGKRKAGRNRKGNPYVRRILCEAAHAAGRTRCSLADKFNTLKIRRGYKRAIFALAHKLLRIVFFIIQRGDHYRDASVDYEELTVRRNAPRWIRMLQKYGYIAA